MDSKRRKPVKFILAALAMAVAGALGAAVYNAAMGPSDQSTSGWSRQCDLPVAQRTESWVCPGP